MEKRERLYILLAYGGLSLFLGFAMTLTLLYQDMVFRPGSLLGVIMTPLVFMVSFFISAKIVSFSMKFVQEDVNFILRLVSVIGVSLILLDLISGGVKLKALLSNISFLAAFYFCTKLFLKPREVQNTQTKNAHALGLAHSA